VMCFGPRVDAARLSHHRYPNGLGPHFRPPVFAFGLLFYHGTFVANYKPVSLPLLLLFVRGRLSCPPVFVDLIPPFRRLWIQTFLGTPFRVKRMREVPREEVVEYRERY
jgi:hypothetical protein